MARDFVSASSLLNITMTPSQRVKDVRLAQLSRQMGIGMASTIGAYCVGLEIFAATARLPSASSS
jgi:hypothetical protein